MRVLFLALISLFWVVHSSIAAEIVGYVVEAALAKPGIESPLTNETMIEIESEGFMVVMTVNGRMIRRDGPFSGAASAILNDGDGSGEDRDLGTDLIESLLELAEVSEMSRSTLGGVRGLTGSDEIRSDAITGNTRVYCMEPDSRPLFYSAKAPTRDELLILRRRADAIGFEQAIWPVGHRAVRWPADWPAPEEGRYVWSLGNKVRAPLWLRAIDTPPTELLHRAAFYFDMRCEAQAIAVFRESVAAAGDH